MIRELLIRSGRQHLLAIPKDGDRNLPCEFEKVSSSEVEMIERRLERYIDSAVSECRDQIYDVYTTNEAEFREQVDDGNSEVRNTATECMNELKEQAQGHMLEIEEQAQQYMKDIEDQGIEVEMSAKKKLGRLFNASAQSLLDSKSSPSHQLGTDARRSSI
jgi:gamma-glutamyl:cysteine ligase YbdK (ATP-grasp superfamily)